MEKTTGYLLLLLVILITGVIVAFFPSDTSTVVESTTAHRKRLTTQNQFVTPPNIPQLPCTVDGINIPKHSLDVWKSNYTQTVCTKDNNNKPSGRCTPTFPANTSVTTLRRWMKRCI